MRITSEGRVTIPRDIREKAGLLPNTEVVFRYTKGRVTLRAKGKRATAGARAVARLRGSLKHLRPSTDELMALTRDENLAHHVVLKQMIDRAAHAFTARGRRRRLRK